MSKIIPYIFAALFSAGLFSCRDFSFSYGDKERFIASVADAELYAEDVESIFTPGITPQDSIARLDAYVDLWIKNQLKIQLSEERFSKSDEADIDKMVENYRNSLLIHKFDEDFVARNMDTAINNDEIVRYYEANRGEFLLAYPIVQGYIIKVPTGFRQEQRVRTLARTGSVEAVSELEDIALKNNLEFHSFPDWTDFSTVMKLMPALPSRDYEKLRSTGGFLEATDNGYRSFLNFTFVLDAGAYVPQRMATASIRVMILNRRKQEMIRALEDSIYNDAIEKKTITIRR